MDGPDTLVNVESAASAAPPVVDLAVSVTGPAMRADKVSISVQF